VARSSQDPESPERRYIEAVWVAPEFRRLGVGRRLVRWLIDRERKSGIREILLWVIDGNVYARSFYFRMGFRSTGRIQPVPGGEKRTEELLAYVIGSWGFRQG
jgi:ribosomal protein S18 acetylase RimI-like enzyme